MTKLNPEEYRIRQNFVEFIEFIRTLLHTHIRFSNRQFEMYLFPLCYIGVHRGMHN